MVDRERNTDRYIERQTNIHSDSQRDRQREIIERDKQIDRLTETDRRKGKDIESERQIDIFKQDRDKRPRKRHI